MKHKVLSTLLFVLGGLPVLLTPVVLMANVMSLAGHRSGDESKYIMLIVYLFATVSSSYFITYLICLFYRFTKKGSNKAMLLSILPLIHLAVAVILFSLWSRYE